MCASALHLVEKPGRWDFNYIQNSTNVFFKMLFFKTKIGNSIITITILLNENSNI